MAIKQYKSIYYLLKWRDIIMQKRNLSFLCALAVTVTVIAFAFSGTSQNLTTQNLGVVSYTTNSQVQSDANAQASSIATPQAQSNSATASQNIQQDIPITVLEISPVTAQQTEQEQTLPSPTIAPANFTLHCPSAILIDQTTGTILYEKNSDEIRAVASITKVMTLLLTFEALHAGKVNMEDIVPISEHAYEMGGSQIWLEPEEVFTLEELVKAICVSSANDAAVAVAEYIGGSEPLFVDMMNSRAKELGMQNTSYKNACGLDETGHVSTAADVAILSRYILQTCPEVLNYTGIWTDTLRNGETHLVNTNKLINHYDGITGLKTGTTGHAGICISASATRDELSLIAVVLGASSSADRFNAATTMLDYGFANYEAALVPSVPNAQTELAVKGGRQEYFALDYSAIPNTLLLAKGGGANLSAVASFTEELKAPISAGTRVGTVKVYDGEILLGEYPITAQDEVLSMTISYAMHEMWKKLCI